MSATSLRAGGLAATGGYFLEYLLDHDDYRRTALADEDRHVITLRLTRRLLEQNLSLSLFVFYSPTDADVYLRPNARYNVTDNLQLTAGANIFLGRDDHTFFGQFDDTNNVYADARYSF